MFWLSYFARMIECTLFSIDGMIVAAISMPSFLPLEYSRMIAPEIGMTICALELAGLAVLWPMSATGAAGFDGAAAVAAGASVVVTVAGVSFQ